MDNIVNEAFKPGNNFVSKEVENIIQDHKKRVDRSYSAPEPEIAAKEDLFEFNVKPKTLELNKVSAENFTKWAMFFGVEFEFKKVEDRVVRKGLFR